MQGLQLPCQAAGISMFAFLVQPAALDYETFACVARRRGWHTDCFCRVMLRCLYQGVRSQGLFGRHHYAGTNSDGGAILESVHAVPERASATFACSYDGAMGDRIENDTLSILKLSRPVGDRRLQGDEQCHQHDQPASRLAIPSTRVAVWMTGSLHKQ